MLAYEGDINGYFYQQPEEVTFSNYREHAGMICEYGGTIIPRTFDELNICEFCGCSDEDYLSNTQVPTGCSRLCLELETRPDTIKILKRCENMMTIRIKRDVFQKNALPFIKSNVNINIPKRSPYSLNIPCIFTWNKEKADSTVWWKCPVHSKKEYQNDFLDFIFLKHIEHFFENSKKDDCVYQVVQ